MSREVAIVRGAVVGVLTAAVHLLLTLGVDLPAEEVVTGLVDAAGLVVAVLLIRTGVTPVADPRDEVGRPLERRDRQM